LGNSIKVGEYNKQFNEILNINITAKDIFRSNGLLTHLMKHNHPECIQYLDKIPEIIENPDYIGVNPNEKGKSVELIKRYENNILMGLKVDTKTNTLYISTLYSLQESKLQIRLNSGRIKKFIKNI